MIEVKNAHYVEDYSIWVEFNNGKAGIIDLKNELWGNVFDALKDMNLFKKFKVSEIMNTIEWENGADLAPEFLYEKINK
jgi:hypothetical protein